MTGSGEQIDVRTERLRLVALDTHLARQQRDDRDAFFTALGARREAAWPPELRGHFSMDRALAALEAAPGEAGWHGWVFLMPVQGGPDWAVGAGGFHGAPGADGAIEISYAMLPSFREQGLATEAVEGLLGWAFTDPNVKSVRARTPAHLAASRRVLEKTGFRLTGEADKGSEKIADYVRAAPQV
ncbi:MAG: GNAT family N-acetyltransferase [Oceanicaulis sp.]|nr:GNAT family N-acetyltransferase [Oceanicaulis sp.]